MLHLRQHCLIVLILGAFGLLYASTLDSHGLFMWDEAEYASIGRSVLDGEGFSIDGHPNALRPPLLPLAGAAAMLVSGSTADVTLKSAVLALALLGLSLLYHSVRLAHGAGTALIAVILLGLSPSFWLHTSYYLSEVPFITFFLGAVLYMHNGMYKDRRYFSYSWLCFGLALLTRYTALLFAPILLLMLGCALIIADQRQEIRSRLLSGSFFLSPLIAAALLMPWLARQQMTFGDVLVGFRQASGQLQVYAPKVSMPWDFYLVNLPGMITWVGVALMALGVLSALQRRDVLGITCILASAFMILWFSLYRFKEVRLITSTLPFLAVLAALGSMRLREQFAPQLDPRWWGVAVGVVLGIQSSLITRPLLMHSVALGYPVLNQAFEFITAETEPGATIMSSIEPQLFWYTRRRTAFIPAREDLAGALESSDWVILVSFERGQPDYALRLLSRFSQSDIEQGHIHMFANQQFQAYVISAGELKKRL
jgi:4-amino-4-deoxy-L-arabinose transferase-like glycosyltransferase